MIFIIGKHVFCRIVEIWDLQLAHQQVKWLAPTPCHTFPNPIYMSKNLHFSDFSMKAYVGNTCWKCFCTDKVCFHGGVRKRENP